MAHEEVNNTGIWHVHKADATAWGVTLLLVLGMLPCWLCVGLYPNGT